jgi:tetratricopeptide (TPR) repeat protein
MRIFSLTLILMSFFIASSAAVSLNDAYKDYLGGDYEEALTKAHILRETDEVLYFLGLSYTKIGNYPQARECFNKLIKNFPRSELYGLSLVKFADTHFLEGNLSRAKALYEEIEKKYPSFDYLPLVYLRLAQIASREGRWEEHKRYSAMIKSKYPDSVEIKFLNILEENINFFTVQVGAFSEKKNAFELKDELQKNYSVYIVEEQKVSYTLYKVRVGKFRDRKEAQEVSYRLIKEGYPTRIYP